MPLDRLLMYVVKNVCQASLAFRPYSTGSILFRSMRNGNCLFSSASLTLLRDNSLVHELGVMAAVELHLNATYAQDPAWKSVYEKNQYVMSGMLFSSYRTGFELVQGL